MSVDKRERELQMSWFSAYNHGAADGDVTLTPSQVLALVVPPSSSTTTVTLPSVFEARGRIYCIISNGNATGTITVVGDGTERDTFAPEVLQADNERLILFSDGTNWNILAHTGSQVASTVAHGAGDGDLTLTADQVNARVVPPASGTTTVTLPAVALARGRFYSVVSNGVDTGTIEVVGAGDEADAYAPAALTADEDIIIAYSDGVNWYTVLDVTTP